MPVSILDNFYTLNHEYTFSGNIAVGDNTDWFHLSRHSTTYTTKFLNTWKHSSYMNVTVNTDSLRPIQWHIVL